MSRRQKSEIERVNLAIVTPPKDLFAVKMIPYDLRNSIVSYLLDFRLIARIEEECMALKNESQRQSVANFYLFQLFNLATVYMSHLGKYEPYQVRWQN
jgi:hypothetical protein